MESADLNLPPDDETRLDALLRRPQAELADDGFSARVLAALPPPAIRPAPLFAPPAARILVLALAALAGCAFARSQGVSFETLGALIPAIQQTADAAPVSVADPIFSTALLVAAISVLYAMKDRLPRVI